MDSKKKRICMALVAHVDSGKTTLSESMLYESGKIRKLGRVDNKDAYLDTFDLEKERGITIFSKQAEFSWKDTDITLLDTPGHVDFSAEMERTLQVLDYAVLVVSAADGVQGHTQTLWRLLHQYQIPTFLFINKMDQDGADKNLILAELKKRLNDNCIVFENGEERTEEFYENVALCEESCMEEFLEKGYLETAQICQLIKERKIFPCYFGSALKNNGVDILLDGIDQYMLQEQAPEEFGAKVFKIARDEQGNRLTYMKITGGKLVVRSLLSGQKTGEDAWEEKVNQIRIYSGSKYESVSEIEAGGICAVTGLTQTHPGEGLGIEKASSLPILEPVLTYRLIFPDDVDINSMLPKLKQLEEEEPELHVVWDEELQELQVQLMGEVQIEILQRLIQERFQVKVSFGVGNIVYKETIANTVEGVGHYEPLRHYAEVHLKMEPAERGSGLQFMTDCSEDILSRNWQRLVMTHLEEREHKGVLTGAAITDMKITLVAGRAHLKHTEGGDFRQATYRAVRQGLMQAQSVLLEPYYVFRLEVPIENVGRAMTDLEQRFAKMDSPVIDGEMAVLSGNIPVVCMRGYQQDVISYTRGRGRLFCNLSGYYPCHNPEEVIEQKGYVAEMDVRNSADSVFCAHGAGFLVPWNEVKEYMHVESDGKIHAEGDDWETDMQEEALARFGPKKKTTEEVWLGTDEIDDILAKTFQANQKSHGKPYKKISAKRVDAPVPTVRREVVDRKEAYLLIDGYNIIFAWDELKELAAVNIDGARGKLMDILCNYQGIKKCNLIVVFDAYRVQGHKTEILDYHNIHVVYTKEAETADQYIEKFAHENGRKYQVTVATSDGLEQIIIRGQGCQLMSAREFAEEIERTTNQLREEYLEKQIQKKQYLLDGLDEETISKLKENM